MDSESYVKATSACTDIVAGLKELRPDWQIYSIGAGVRALSEDGVILRYDVVREPGGYVSSVASRATMVTKGPIKGTTPRGRVTKQDIVADFWERCEPLLGHSRPHHLPRGASTDSDG